MSNPSTSSTVAASKWADYLISAVRFNEAETHIEYHQVRRDKGDTVSGDTETYSRADVAAAFHRNVSFCTIVKGPDGNWKRGQRVYLRTINGVEYPETVADKTAIDNLDNLPRF